MILNVLIRRCKSMLLNKRLPKPAEGGDEGKLVPHCNQAGVLPRRMHDALHHQPLREMAKPVDAQGIIVVDRPN